MKYNLIQSNYVTFETTKPSAYTYYLEGRINGAATIWISQVAVTP